MPISTAAALVAAQRILDSVCPKHTPLMLLTAASIIQLSVNKDEAATINRGKAKAASLNNVLPFRGRG